MKDEIFQNLNSQAKPKGFLDILKWKLRSKQPIWPKDVPLIANDKPPKRLEGDEIRISFVGHVIPIATINAVSYNKFSIHE